MALCSTVMKEGYCQAEANGKFIFGQAHWTKDKFECEWDGLTDFRSEWDEKP